MPKNSLTDYSATNASNTDVGGINIDEGMLPSDVNNAIREVMTHLKEFESGTSGITKLSATDAEITGTGAIKVPVGTTAQRPTPAQGQIRYNTTDSSFEGYDGSAWGAIGGGSENSFTVFEYTATASQTTFSGADDNAATLSYTAGNIQVMLNGVVLDPSDFTATNGTSVVLASGAALNDVLNIYAFTSFTVADTVPASTGGTFSANVAITGDLTVDTNTLYVDSTNNRVGIGTSSPVSRLEIEDAGTASSVLLKVTADDQSPYGIVVGNDTYSTSDTDGLTLDVNNSGVSSVRARGTGSVLKFDANGSERMRIDSSGNVGIGEAAPVTPLTIATTNKLGSTFTGTTNGEGLTVTQTNFTAGNYISLVEAAYDDSNDANPNVRIGAMFDGSGSNLAFGTSNNFAAGITNTAMFIDNSGRVMMGQTSAAPGAAQLNIDAINLVSLATNHTADYYAAAFYHNGNLRGYIYTTNTGTSFNTSSDYRLKENVTADWDATTRLKQLNPVRFNFIADPDTTVDGFLAHEVQDIVPEAITGTKDAMRDEEYEVTPATGDIYTAAIPATFDEDGNEVTAAVDEVVHSSDVERPETLADGQQWRETTPAVMGTRSVPDYQGIDQSKLVPLLVKTIQELEARITALETA